MSDDIERNLAAALDHHGAGRLDEAAALYERVIEAAPDHAAALHNLGVVRAQSGDPAAAIALFERALAAKPDYPQAHLNLGSALRETGRLEEAAEALGRALALDPGLYPAHFARALALAALGRDEEAMEHFAAMHAIRRAAPPPEGVSRHKLRHDVAQYRWLAAEGIEPGRFAALAEHFTALEGRTDWPAEEDTPAALDDEVLAASFSAPPHVAPAPAIDGAVLADGFDPDAVVQAFRTDTPGIAVIDPLLSDEALAALRKSLLESTIWYDFTHIPGFVAAYLEDGLASPLLLQIAGALREALPAVLDPHPLAQGWAFKGVAGDRPIDLHADSAAVSLNFWITPDDAREDLKHGGLTIYTVPPPAGWTLTDYGSDSARIRDFLAGQEENRLTVPYGENRAVLFESGLFHGSDAPRFRPGYENHRINITLLFGEREN
ncbi:MAG: tetratricopeptide repeat protein [Alphaproteobacteria bacterium]|nr:tetratricopeptide repeat protein [Alphaproteobacteria bacterium]